MRFLGFRTYAFHRRILGSNLRRFNRRMRRYAGRVAQGTMPEERVRCSLHACLGYAGPEKHRVFINQVLRPIQFQTQEAPRGFSYWVP